MHTVALALALFAGVSAAAESRNEKITLTLDDGRAVEATLRHPPGTHGPLPALMLFGGFRRGGKVLDLVQLEQPVIWANFDYPYELPRKFQFPGSLLHAADMRVAIHGSFEGVVKLHAALKRRADVDPARITVIGASAGAPFALVGAARSKIPGVILVQGFADAPLVIQNLIERKHRAKYGDWFRWPARWAALWINWYCEIPDLAEPARALTAGQKVLLIDAENDDFIPRPASEALWQALEQSGAVRERIVQPGLHLRPEREGEIEKVLRPAVAWLEKKGLL